MRKRKRGLIYNKVYRGECGGRKWIQGDDMGGNVIIMFIVMIRFIEKTWIHCSDVSSS